MDRDQDEIEFEKNIHEMRFAPEIHEINHRGTKKPIKRAGQGLRGRLEQKLDYLNSGQF